MKSLVNEQLTFRGSAVEIGREYFQRGEYDKARGVLQDGLNAGRNLPADTLLKLHLMLAIVEQWDGHCERAVEIYLTASPLAEVCDDNGIKGKFYFNFAYAYRRLEKRDEAIDALTAASVYYERAGEKALRAEVENNLGNLKSDAGRFEDAAEHFKRALEGSDDPHSRAQVYESMASAFLAEGKAYPQALHCAMTSLQLLEGTDRTPLLEESIDTLSRICGVLKKTLRLEREHEQIKAALEEAQGHITAAARKLGLDQRTLAWKLDNQFRDLLPLRIPKKQPRGPHAHHK